jgi:hypothetical protein
MQSALGIPDDLLRSFANSDVKFLALAPPTSHRLPVPSPAVPHAADDVGALAPRLELISMSEWIRRSKSDPATNLVPTNVVTANVVPVNVVTGNVTAGGVTAGGVDKAAGLAEMAAPTAADMRRALAEGRVVAHPNSGAHPKPGADGVALQGEPSGDSGLALHGGRTVLSADSVRSLVAAWPTQLSGEMSVTLARKFGVHPESVRDIYQRLVRLVRSGCSRVVLRCSPIIRVSAEAAAFSSEVVTVDLRSMPAPGRVQAAAQFVASDDRHLVYEGWPPMAGDAARPDVAPDASKPCWLRGLYAAKPTLHVVSASSDSKSVSVAVIAALRQFLVDVPPGRFDAARALVLFRALDMQPKTAQLIAQYVAGSPGQTVPIIFDAGASPFGQTVIDCPTAPLRAVARKMAVSPMAVKPLRVCDACGRCDAGPTTLLPCQICRAVWYCSIHCRNACRTTHRQLCQTAFAKTVLTKPGLVDAKAPVPAMSNPALVSVKYRAGIPERPSPNAPLSAKFRAGIRDRRPPKVATAIGKTGRLAKPPPGQRPRIGGRSGKAALEAASRAVAPQSAAPPARRSGRAASPKARRTLVAAPATLATEFDDSPAAAARGRARPRAYRSAHAPNTPINRRASDAGTPFIMTLDSGRPLVPRLSLPIALSAESFVPAGAP